METGARRDHTMGSDLRKAERKKDDMAGYMALPLYLSAPVACMVTCTPYLV
jgi:hypothetical protein